MFGNRVKELREARKISRSEFSRRFGVSHTAVYKWENGSAQPSIETLQEMATFFGVTMDDLCDYQRPEDSMDDVARNIAVMNRAFGQLTQEEQEKMLAVGRALFDHAFGKEEA